jgi:hypothetical protein
MKKDRKGQKAKKKQEKKPEKEKVKPEKNEAKAIDWDSDEPETKIEEVKKNRVKKTPKNQIGNPKTSDED